MPTLDHDPPLVDSAIPDYILDSVRSLPPLPTAVQQLLSLARKADVNFSRIARIVESDQTLTARTLRAANSALYGMSRRVETVSKATVLLGREAIVNLALSVSVMSLHRQAQKEWPIDPTDFWRHNMGVALTARMMAQHFGRPDAEQAFVAGLMHDIGKLVMLNHHGDAYADVLKMPDISEEPLHRLERNAFEADHTQIGYLLCLHWNMPDALAEAVACHHGDQPIEPLTLAGVVRDANALVKMSLIGDSGDACVKLFGGKELPRHQLPPEKLNDWLRALPDNVREAEQAFDQTASEETAPSEPSTRPPVRIHLANPSESELVTILLQAMGYAPLPAGDANDVSVPLVTDQDVTPTGPAPVLNCHAAGVSGLPARNTYINIERLRAWLTERLQPATERA